MKGKKLPLRRLCACALMIAMQIVLNRFVSIQTLGLKFGVSFLPMALTGALFGPWWAAVSYMLADLLGYFLNPLGPLFPGFTLSCGLMGVCYGLFLRRQDKLRYFPDVVVPAVFCTVPVGLLLNSLWVSILYTSKGYGAWFLQRLPQEAGLFILHMALLPFVWKLAQILKKAGLA